MKLHKDLNNFSAKNPAITVGTFDGVHLGHLQILNKLKDKARSINGESVVVTFWPHPRIVLGGKESKVQMINTINEKVKLIAEQGIDHLIILRFTKNLAKLTSCEFIEKYLCNKLNIKALIVGYDHHFGKDREGNFEVLSACAKKYNFDIDKVQAFSFNGKNVSSTLIRNTIRNGEIEKTNSYLSKEYSISGEIVGGQKIGRNIGFPTANIYISESYKITPLSGVYAVKTEIAGKLYSGMLNIGHKPTINNNKDDCSIEVHILDFTDDIYNENIKVYFYKRIRSEKKFQSLQELKQQLIKDKETIRQYFKMN